MTIAELNKNVIKLWGESKYESHTVGRLAPLLYPSNTNLHAPIVALGLNPSFGHVDSYNRLRDTKEMEIRRLCAEIGGGQRTCQNHSLSPLQSHSHRSCDSQPGRPL